MKANGVFSETDAAHDWQIALDDWYSKPRSYRVQMASYTYAMQFIKLVRDYESTKKK